MFENLIETIKRLFCHAVLGLEHSHAIATQKELHGLTADLVVLLCFIAKNLGATKESLMDSMDDMWDKTERFTKDKE